MANHQQLPNSDLPSTWEEVTAAFEDHLYQRGRSRSTITGYGSSLRNFSHFHMEELDRPGLYLSKLSVDDLQAFVQWLRRSRHFSAASINRTVSALREFARFLLRRGWHRDDVALGLKHRRTMRKRHVHKLSTKQLKGLRSAVDQHTLTGERDIAILELMLGSGLRVSEVPTINVGNVDLDCSHVLVEGKTQRTIPLSRQAQSAIKSYLKTREELGSRAPLFVSHLGKRISSITVQHLVKKYLSIAGFPDLSARDLRRHFVAATLERSGDLEEIQRLIGHKSARSTRNIMQQPS